MHFASSRRNSWRLREEQAATVPLIIGHRLMGHALLLTGDLTEGRAHYNRSLALYDPAKHRSMAAIFGQDAGMAALSHRSWTLWLLGYPEAALADAEQALSSAREMGHAATLMYALYHAAHPHIYCGQYAAANAHVGELARLADDKGALLWKAYGMLTQGVLLTVAGKPLDAVQIFNSGITAYRSTRATEKVPWWLSYLARAHAELGQFDDAWRCIGEAVTAVEITKERWCEAEAYRFAGEIALQSPTPDTVKAEAYFERALAVARQQRAKSWELRAAMSLARLRRDQGNVAQARDLLAPVYDWFTEGFETHDLKEAKALLGTIG